MKARRWWTMVAVLVGTGGVTASVVTAHVVAEDARARADQHFDRAAAEAVANIQREVVHLTDLSVNAQAFVRRNPDLSNVALRSWAEEVQLLQRYPAVLTLGVTKVVTDAELDAVAAAVGADPPDATTSEFRLDPAERAAAYCISTAAVARPEARMPLGKNMCPGATADLAKLMKSMDGTLVIPTNFDGKKGLAVDIPLYRSPTPPPTPEEREAEFIGHLGVGFEPVSLMAAAIETHPELVVSLAFDDPTEKLNPEFREGAFRTGEVPDHARKRMIDVGGGWTAAVAEPVASTGILTSGSARNLLVGGSVLSLLLAVLLYVLATGRDRALRLVAVKTDELRHQALHDPLTGLANRTLLKDRAEQLLLRARRSGSTPTCLFLDLDGFKSINDSLGHEAGDLLLCAVTTRLQGAIRDVDTIARMGGDEFVVLLDGAEVDTGSSLVAERIREALAQPFEVEGVETAMHVTVSVGIATGPRDTAEDLFRDADVALYQAKAAGRNCVVSFRPDMHEAAQHGTELELGLRTALERDEFRLMYQPVYNLDDLTLVSFEALLRWEHPTLGMIQPNDFIPLLERSGHIVEVGRWVLLEACRQLAAWRRKGMVATVSVNVASQQFDRGTLVDDVRDALAAAGLEPSALTIEITETSLMQSLDVTAVQLMQLRETGVAVAIDDFGTGYSSLSSLQRLPVDAIKIDRSFITGMVESDEARALVRTIIQLGKDLGLKTLAEGVETTEQMDDLRGESVDEAQGFLLARPLDPTAVERTFLLGAPARPAPSPARGW